MRSSKPCALIASAFVLLGCSPPEARPELARSLPSGIIELPELASSGARFADNEDRVAISISIAGAGSIDASPRDGGFRYERAIDGHDLVWRYTATGAEDFVDLDRRIPGDRIEYRIDLEKAGGLRLVAGVLEVLDELGTPRIRATPASVSDADGYVHAATTTVEGCDVDEDPRAPWGRRPIDPGARSCSMIVAWDGSRIAYPAVLDPGFSFTQGNVVTPRWCHTMTALDDGTVLLAGGSASFTGGADTAVANAELYDPATDVFAATAPMIGTRLMHTATLLSDGRVLVAGGSQIVNVSVPQTVLSSAEIFDPVLATWTAAGPLAGARAQHTATLLPSGDVLVVGGIDDVSLLASAETFHVNGFSSSPSLITPRSQHSATLLDDGTVFVTGGCATPGYPECVASLQSTEILSAAGSAPGPDLAHPRAGHTGINVGGKVLLVDGTEYTFKDELPQSTTEIYDGQTMTAGPALMTPGFTPRLYPLASGRILVIVEASDTDEIDGALSASIAGPKRPTLRNFFESAALPNGEVLVAGGSNTMSNLEPRAERLTFAADGATCKTDVDCASGICDLTTGVCCASACGAACHACIAGTGACAPVISADDPDTCTGDSTCDAMGACKKLAGKPCGAAGECVSGFCADGVCCDKACTGQCEACDIAIMPGVCGLANGKPHGARMACDGAGTFCGSTCDGTSPDCVFTPSAAVCQNSCQGSTVGVGQCDGKGACAGDVPAPCPGNLVCADAATCKVACTKPEDCVTGYACQSNQCVPDTATCEMGHIRSLPDGTTQDCAPYTCDANGDCRTKCSGVDQCVNPFVCDENGTCSPPATTPDDSGCSCRSGRDEGGGAGSVTLLFLMAAAALRRRRGVH